MFPSGLFPLGLPTKTLYVQLLSTISATCPTHLILLDLTTSVIFGEYRTYSSLLSGLLHSPITLYHLSTNIFLSTLFWNTLSLYFSLNVRDQTSHPYKTMGKIIILYIINFIFLDRKLEDNRFRTEWQQAFWLQSAPNFFINRILNLESCAQVLELF
jgi:hypothetical protein